MAQLSSAEAPLIVRPATPDDVDRVFEWANDPAAREASFDTRPIPYERHRAWFGAQLERADRNPFVAELAGEPVAFLRLDRSDERGDECLVSVNVAPGARGKGLGTRALEAAAEQAARLGFGSLRALVRPENEASARAFIRAGYAEQARERVGEQEARVFTRPASSA